MRNESKRPLTLFNIFRVVLRRPVFYPAFTYSNSAYERDTKLVVLQMYRTASTRERIMTRLARKYLYFYRHFRTFFRANREI